MINQVQNRNGLKARQICKYLPVSPATLRRWQQRDKNGEPLLKKPGPKKLGPLPLAEIQQQIGELKHGIKRSGGMGEVYKHYRHQISRREFATLVEHDRQEHNRKRKAEYKRVEWKQANLAWAIDATEHESDQQGKKLILIVVKDLGSRYQFEPHTALKATGQEVAEYIERLFKKYRTPLFLKRDNGSIFNDQSVNEVLARHGVIPLNSPAYYARYNGGIEKGIYELKAALKKSLPQPAAWELESIGAFVGAVNHLRNCRARRSLEGHTATEAYHHMPQNTFSQKQRHHVFEWIKSRSNVIMENMEKVDRRSLSAAWRKAAETWLRCQGLITVSKNGIVLPHLPTRWAH